MSEPRAEILRQLPPGEARPLTLPTSPAAPSKGFEDGYREGMATARREAEQLLDAAQARLQQERETLQREYAERVRITQQVIDSFTAEKQRLADKQEQAVVALAYEALLRVLDDAHAMRPLLSRIVARRLANDPSGPLAIRLSPQDVARIEADLAAHLASRSEVILVADEKLSTGECFIDTPQGSEDVSLATQLNRLTSAWLAVLGETPVSNPQGGAR